MLTENANRVYIFCMGKKISLSPNDRDFFRLASRAAFCNPFSDERVALDLKIAECSQKVTPYERLDCVIEKVNSRVSALEAKKQADTRLYDDEERVIMQGTFMFEGYHRFTGLFDQLITDQIEAGDDPCPVPFAGDAIAWFIKRGFTAKESYRYFALLWQTKRAYYFIDKRLIGQSASMKAVQRSLWNNVFTNDIRLYERYLLDRMEDFSTLLLGETGTGKGTAAEAIGRSGFIPYDSKRTCFSESFMRSFISIDLSQKSESLIESELFGHKKGAFTGAIEKHHGIFARCSPHGSILLDEIGDVSLPVQLKLLQLLQNRTFSPVGGHEKLRFNGRVIAATNRPIDQLRKDGHLRNDFYYRLCSDCIVVPPLRQRLKENPGELDLILTNVIFRLIGEESPELVAMVRDALHSSLGPHYFWPGNVRELEQATRRILLTGQYTGDSVLPEQESTKGLLSEIEQGELNAQELLSDYCALLYDRYGNYEEVARRTNLDRRTVKRYIQLSKGKHQG